MTRIPIHRVDGRCGGRTPFPAAEPGAGGPAGRRPRARRFHRPEAASRWGRPPVGRSRRACRSGGPGAAGWPGRRVVALGLMAALLFLFVPAGTARGAGFWPGPPAVGPVEPAPALPLSIAGAGAAVETPWGTEPALGPAGGGGRPGTAGGAAAALPASAGQQAVPEGVAPLWRSVVAPPPAIDAAAAVLMDAASGQVLYAHNPHQRRAPASTTKILTAIVALEFGNLDDVVTVSEHAASTEGSTMDLVAGERYTLRELLWGLMLESGNDAAVAIAEHISGSEAAFARLMNDTARRLGLRDTHFTNPHGLHDPAHYTTAYDLAVMTRYALANDYFARLVCQPEKVLCRGDGDWVRILASTNRLLWYHEWIRGVKTGTTNAAGPCLVSSGEQGGRRLIAVVLDSGDRWADSEALLEWGFDQFAPAQGGRAGDEVGQVAVEGGRRPRVEVVLGEDLSALVPPALVPRVQRVVQLPRRVEAPVAPGQRLGTAALVLDGVPLARTALVAAAGVDLAPWWRRWWPW